MATLADSFLQDLDDLNDDLEDDFVTEGFEDDEDYIIDAVEEYERAQTDSVTIVSDLSEKEHFKRVLQDVRRLKDTTAPVSESIYVKDTDEYILINECNKLVIQIDTEILNIHKFIRDIYSKKFPELESIVPSPLEYIAIVKRVQNEIDLTHVDLSDLLPNTVIMAVTVAASMTTGSLLPPNELEKTLGATEEAIQLAESRKEILMYLESRMNLLAPNLTSLLGSSLAARLLTHAGGLLGLARIPAQNIMLIGSSRRGSFGFGNSNQKGNYGIISASEIIQNTAPTFRSRAIKMLATKCGLAARVDSFHESPGGEMGTFYRDYIIKTLIKIQEPPPAPQKKALPVPDEKPKTKRGGKRLRRMKEKYGMTEVRKQSNRLKFGEEAEEEVGLEFGKGLGMLGVSRGTGKVRLQVKQKRPTETRKRHISQASSGATDGMSSSLIFTPVQGLELTNPDATRVKPKMKSDDYFSNTAKFMKI